MTTSRGMIPEDVYELTGVADPRLSPDGRTVAFVVWRIDRETNEYRSSIWLGPLDGSAPLRRFTWGPKTDAEARWSPDGSHLAFVSVREDKKPSQLYAMRVDGGEPRKLTDLKEDVDHVAWSPDGTCIAFTSRVRDPAYDEEDAKKRRPRRFTRLQYKLDSVGWTGDRPQHLFVVPADGSSEPAQLTHGEFEDASPAWSPDGRRIAFSSARHDDWDLEPVRDIYVTAADGSGEPVKLTTSDGDCASPSWSPDGARIAYLLYPAIFDDPRHVQVAVISAAGGERTVLTDSLDRTCNPYPELREPLWEGDSVLFAIEDAGNSHLYRVAADRSSKPELVIGGDRVLVGYDAAGGELVHAVTTPTELAELFAGERKLTDVGSEFIAGRELGAPERFVATSADGAEIDAWIVRPAGLEPGARCPVLVNIHGGPFTQYGNKFFDEFQVYAGAGYAVVYSNPRGSSGYSEEWGRAIRGPIDGPGWGSVDYEDVMAVTDETLRRFDYCDSERVGVIGGSYGGFLTTWIVGHTDRFAAACSERALNNWVSQWGSSDFGWATKAVLGAHEFEDVNAYLEVSPSTYASSITTPLLILHSENDLRCPIEQAEHLFTTLRLLKRDVEFVRFAEESHELSRSGSPAHRVMRFEVILEYFGRKLKDRAPA